MKRNKYIKKMGYFIKNSFAQYPGYVYFKIYYMQNKQFFSVH